jgi:hypothetical protein
MPRMRTSGVINNNFIGRIVQHGIGVFVHVRCRCYESDDGKSVDDTTIIIKITNPDQSY